MKNKNGLVVVLLIISILLSSANLFYTYYNLQNEYKNYDGKENYDKVMMLQKAQIKAQFGKLSKEDIEKQIKIMLGSDSQAQENTNSGDKKVALTDIPKKEFIYGDDNAEITLFEHSDFNCGYCKKLHNSGTMEKLVKDYAGKVNYVHKNRPVIGGENSMNKAKVVMCVGKLGGAENYYKMNSILFEKSLNSKEDIISEIESLGLNKDDFSNCLNSQEMDTQIEKTIEEGSKFGARGTPGTIVMNNKTGEWTFVSGAVPYENFKTEIDKLLTK